MAEDDQEMAPGDFSPVFKTKMIASYPQIAQMTGDELYFANVMEADEAFQRILDSRNLRRTCEIEFRRTHG